MAVRAVGGGHPPAYADGELPLWNPYQGAGAPLAANMQSAVFDPLLLAVNLHPTPLTWDLSIDRRLRAGRCRRVPVRTRPRASASFRRSSPAPRSRSAGGSSCTATTSFSRSYVFLPLLFLLVELVLRSRRLLPVLGLGVAVAGNIYVGMPEASFFVIGARLGVRGRAARAGATADAARVSPSSDSAAPACWA